MTRDASPPPPFPAPRRLALAWLPLWIALGLAFLSLAGQFASRWNIPLPSCLFRQLTGLPCLSCGSTRSLTAWSQLDLPAAFRFNPLFFLLCAGLLTWLALWITERLTRRPLLAPAWARFRRWPLWRILIALILANWLYLCLALPR